MKSAVLVHTGPLIALIDDRDQWHAWAKDQFAAVSPPLLTCEAVLSETCFLAGRMRGGNKTAMGLFQRGVIALAFSAKHELSSLDELMRRYANVPMSLADACLVRMSELVPESVVLTLDSDFRIYRKNRRQKIPLLIPRS